ncbi:unnamed protein product [Brachionus calyciflorus]|uniref:Reverse transcriptase domain-containing protein n=1 Tax=Brachionus calyciflorus TaxID=104777 RepID=A0A814NN50_9BILA|nr:unnamed protein product [Brachionus calyciflorus]
MENNPLNKSIDDINKCIHNLLINNFISQKIFDCRVILNKVKLVDLVIKPIVQNILHILKDSQQLLQQLENKYINNKPFIYCGDFESLYTNMEPDHVCQILIIDNNYFLFLDLFFKQLKGIAMGCKCGPNLDNLFLYFLEKNWLSLNSVLLYASIIDDLLIISDFKINLDKFIEVFGYLKLNIVCKNEVEFFDLNISHDSFLNKIKFKLFIIPTNNVTYLLPYSNHPSHIFYNIPFSLFSSIDCNKR